MTRALLFLLAGLLPSLAIAGRQAGSDQIGAAQHPAIIAQFGGEINDKTLSKYVSSVGHKMADLTDEAGDNWTFTVLDTPVVNAFALPGGYVYVTRGLLGLANNEAELAGVLGHEIGHVISGHGERRAKRQNRVGLGVVLGTILGGVLGGQDGAADAIRLGTTLAGGMLASYSQKEEFQADSIGVRLLARAGYQPGAEADFLKQLLAKEALERRVSGMQYNPNRVDFFASHPATGKRVQKAAAAAKKTGLRIGDGALGEKTYLSHIDGVIYGDVAEEGYVRGRIFSHPRIGVTFTAPEGFILHNMPQRIVALHKSGARMIVDGDKRWDGRMDGYIQKRWRAQIARDAQIGPLRDLRNVTINGLPGAMAMADVITDRGPEIVQLTAVRLKGMTLRIAGLTLKSEGRSRNALNSSAQSLRRLSATEIADLHPYRISIHTVKAGDTIAKLAQTMPLTGYRDQQFRAMNGYGTREKLRVGDLVKIVK